MNRIPDILLGKIRRNIGLIGNDLRDFPTVKDGNYLSNREKAPHLGHIFNWTQSFFTGMALWAYADTGDKYYLDWVLGFQKEYADKLLVTPMETMHDLGFLYMPYSGMLYEITHEPEYKNMTVKAADLLAMRFEPKGGYIRAWGRMDNIIPEYVEADLAGNCFFTENRGLSIIDSMMNLPLLFRASELTGHPYYRKIACAHADTTLRYFIRQDYSVCHAYRFIEDSGEPLGEANYCGYSNGSFWARGTAWAIYGFALASRYTGRQDYLDASVRILEKFMRECGETAPVWDFRLPSFEEAAYDTSAAAITLCAVMELETLTQRPALTAYEKRLRGILNVHIDEDETRMGLLGEQNGQHGSAPYGDYFLIESFMKENQTLRVW